jgi:curli biogenesis system outer membrane secretion channel CsgG
MKVINTFLVSLFPIFFSMLIAGNTYAVKKEEVPLYEPKEWPTYDGPKSGIAILNFENGISMEPIATFLDKDSGIQVYFGLGEGMANMLTTTLLETNRFRVTEKKIAKQVFELYTKDAATKIYGGDKSKLSEVPGIRYFVLGSITDYTDGSSGAKGGIGFGGLKLGGGTTIAAITMHMRIIDTSSGEVIYSKRQEGVAEQTKRGIDFSGLGVDANFSAFQQSPLGQAIQIFLDRCVEDIIQVTSS